MNWGRSAGKFSNHKGTASPPLSPMHAHTVKLTPTDTDDHPAAIPNINRPVNNNGLNAGLSVVTVRSINSHPMVYGILQRMMDNLRPK